jgi:hypothetical protein
VRALAKKGGDERMNEACLDMQKSGTSYTCGGVKRADGEGRTDATIYLRKMMRVLC